MAQYDPNQLPSIPQGTPPPNPPQNPSQQPWITKGNIGGVAFDIEFNDSVLSTQGWNNPRYDGCKTITQILNQYTDGDATLGKTTAVQKYTRNFYIGRTVRFLDETDQTSPLVEFPGGAYVVIDGVATINSDNTLSNNNFQGEPSYVKKGFYRSFFDDFPVGKEASIKLLDSTVSNNLEESYNVYFNQGILRKVITAVSKNSYGTDSFVKIRQLTTDPYFQYGDIAENNASSITDDFDLTLGYTQKFTTISSLSTWQNLVDLFDDLIDYKTANYSERNFYVTPILGSGTYTFTDFDNNFNNRKAFNIFELSTNHDGTVHKIVLNPKFGINTDEYEGITNDRGYIISTPNDALPSLLLNIPTTDLPSGVGDLPFIVIPHNLHPLIKDNIEYFAQRANINIPVNNNIKFNPRNTQLR